MKLHLLAVLLLFTLPAVAGEPALKSANETTYTPNTGSAYGDINEIVLEWELPAVAGGTEKRAFRVSAHRRLDPNREDLRYWSATLTHSDRALDRSPDQWFSAPRMSRDECVAIVSKSKAELDRRHPGEDFKYFYLEYHFVQEHELELNPLIKKALATTKGGVVGKHRGLMHKLSKVFHDSKSIAETCTRLQEQGMNFESRGMTGDYYTPADPRRAATWKDAAELEGFGLTQPPGITFARKEIKKQETSPPPPDKPAAKSKPKSKQK